MLLAMAGSEEEREGANQTLADVLASKDKAEFVRPRHTVREAASIMAAQKKAVVVVEEGELVGIFTPKDMLNRVIAKVCFAGPLDWMSCRYDFDALWVLLLFWLAGWPASLVCNLVVPVGATSWWRCVQLSSLFTLFSCRPFVNYGLLWSSLALSPLSSYLITTSAAACFCYHAATVAAVSVALIIAEA